MSIYVANLAEYNAGNLVGKWIDLPCNNLGKKIKKLLGKDEEYAIHDYEADITIGEYDNPFKLNELAEKLEELNEYDRPKVTILVDYYGFEYSEAIDRFDELEFYSDMTIQELAEHYIDEGFLGEIPDHLRNYIDVDAYARDLQHDYTETKHGIHRLD